ncbi:hypothetical protein [Brevibacillus laterosporus]|uniref:hypothetical protein n=1 Tax=Brevibacillus laterosporus TaxID=1465 RepID=UPI0026554223|nr:hypothetical protein [Brevibacillus laterosporus]MDN9012734.1 hypothetical protein [Brevibacillus laterosporus]MDO0943841.1 hypothetical protein [Brevibacillus laterosporus]
MSIFQAGWQIQLFNGPVSLVNFPSTDTLDDGLLLLRQSGGLGRLGLQSVYHQKENYQSGKESFHSSSPYLYASISIVINVNAILLICSYTVHW